MKLKRLYSEVKIMKNLSLTPHGKEILDNYDTFRNLLSLYDMEYELEDYIDNMIIFGISDDWDEYPYKLGEYFRNYLSNHSSFTIEWLIQFSKEWGVLDSEEDIPLFIEKLKPYIKF